MPATAPPAARAQIAAAEHARRLADATWELVATLADLQPEQRIAAARRLRFESMAVLQLTALSALLAGMTWADFAMSLGLNVATARADYEEVARLWETTDPADASLPPNWMGLRTDADPRATAEALDTWVARHATDQTLPLAAEPVSRLLPERD